MKLTFEEVLIDKRIVESTEDEYPFKSNKDEINRVHKLFIYSDSINIKDLINILEKLKEKGSERVYVRQGMGFEFVGIKSIEIKER